MAGSVLSSSSIEGRLGQGELFRPGSWDANNIRGSSYDLRIAGDMMNIPDGKGGRQSFELNEVNNAAVILDPGDMGYFTSQERLFMPWDIAGNIGVKFTFAGQGFLVHTGMIVDPGFGQVVVDGAWQPAENARLNFLVANLNDVRLALEPGTAIASIQFLKLDGDVTRGPRSSVGATLKTKYLDHERSPALAFFTEQENVKRQLERVTARVDGIEGGTRNIILFGVYLVASAFLGVALTFFFQLASDGGFTSRIGRGLNNLHLNWPRAYVVGAAVFAVVAAFAAIVTSLVLGARALIGKLLRH